MNTKSNQGVIITHYGVAVDVRLEDGQVLSKVRVRRKSGHVVGDYVTVDDGRLTRLERSGELKRRTTFGRVQTMAANLDGLGLVVAPEPILPRGFVDRGVVAARSGGMKVFVVVNKSDLDGHEDLMEYLTEVYGDGVTLLPVSAESGEGLDRLSQHLSNFQRVALVGPSGAGKSSLLNALIPEAMAEVGAISDANLHGRHTTTKSTQHDLPLGGHLVDTPGIREMGVVDISLDELAHHFHGFEKLDLKGCRFRNCVHLSEPGCVVKIAVEDEEVPEERYETYRELAEELRAL